MKKLVISVGLLSQVFCYGMQRDWTSDKSEATALVLGNFCEQGAKIFQEALQTNIDDVMENRITVETALANVNGSYQGWIDMLKTRINQTFFEQLGPKYDVMMQEVKSIAEKRDLEINNLKQQLSSLLSSDTESLRVFDKEIRQSEQKVRERRDKAEHVEIPSLVTDLQVERTLSRFGRELSQIKEEIKEGTRTLESAFERTQERYGDSIDGLINSLQDRYEDIIKQISERYAERCDRMNEAYEQQKTLLKKMINEVVAANLKLEKAKERHSQISRIFICHPELKPEKIMIKSSELDNKADIATKHEVTSAIFDKLKFFKDLYKNKKDLDTLRHYLDQTLIPPMPDKPMEKPICHNNGGFWGRCRGGEIEWEWGGDVAWINGKMQVWLREMGVNDFPGQYDNRRGAASWGTQEYGRNWKPRAEAEYNRRLAIYQQKMHDRNVRIARAIATPFPSQSFDSLVDQFNMVVSEL